MALTNEQLCEKLGLDPATATDEEVEAALDAKLAAPEPPADPPAGEPNEPAGEPVAEVTPAAAAAALKKFGMAAVDQATLDALKTQAKEGSDAYAAIQAENDGRTIEDAIRAGKIRPADRDKWAKNLKLDRETYAAALKELEPVFPVQEVGHGQDPDPAASMSAPDDLAWFDSAPLEPASGAKRAND